MIVLSGGGLAAAATTSPGHGWGPLTPLSRVLHPGWTDDSLAAKRAVVVRELQTGRRSVPVGAEGCRRRDLRRRHPSAPTTCRAVRTPTLQAQIAAVAQQIGLSGDPTATTIPPLDPAAPVVSPIRVTR